MQRLKLQATDQSLSELKAIEHNSAYTQTVRQRARALLFVAQGKVISQAAKMCGVHKESVRGWVHDFNQRGIEGICNTSGRRRNDGCAVDTPNDTVIRREGGAADAALKLQSDEQHETSGDPIGSNRESLAAISDAMGSTGTRGHEETVRQKPTSVASTVQADTSVQAEVDDPMSHVEPLAFSDVQVRQKANESPTTVADGRFHSTAEAHTGTLHVMTGASANGVPSLAVAKQVVRDARRGEATGDEGAAAGGTLKQVQVIRCETYVYDSEKDELSLERTSIGAKIQDTIELDLHSVVSFAASISKIEKNISQTYNEVMRAEIIDSINNKTSVATKKSCDCYLETEHGGCKITKNNK